MQIARNNIYVREWFILKKYLILMSFTVAVISWLMIIPVGVQNSYTQVETLRAPATNVVTTVDCSGTLEAAIKANVTLGCKVKISKNYFNIGDKVKKGDKLLEIDKSVTLQALAYNDTASTNSSSSSANPQITSGDAANALKQALSSGIIGKGTYSSLLNQIGNSSSGATVASTSSDSSTSSDTVTDSEKALDSVENSLCSPISGVITEIADGADGITPAATPVATIVDMNSIQVKAQVNEENVKNVKVGQQVVISGSGFNGTYSGEVKKIYPIAENVTTLSDTSNMVYIIVSINKPDANLLPGLTATVKITTSKQCGVVTLPYDSIQQDDNGTEYVYTFINGCAIRKNITTGTEDDNGAEVLKGVSQGEVIIEDPSDTITDGMSVRIK